MTDLEFAIKDIKNKFENKYSPLIFDITVSGKTLIGFVLLFSQKDEIIQSLNSKNLDFEDKIEALTNLELEPALGHGEITAGIVYVFSKPIENISILSPRGLNRLRATQLKRDDQFVFRILFKKENWFLIQIFDGTLAWIEASNFEIKEDYIELEHNSLMISEGEFIDKYLGIPYLLGGTSLQGIDCSGLIQRFYLEVKAGIIPKNSQDQRKLGERIESKNLKNGDLIFAESKKTKIKHVALFLDSCLYHACLREKKVIEEDLEDFKRYYDILECRRVEG